MKKIISLLIVLAFLFVGFYGCADVKDDGKTEIVCTVFPIYDWLRNIVGEESEDIEISLLIKNGTDPHSYSPTPADIVKISGCDVLIMVGGESDKWISDVLKGKTNEDMTVIRLLDLMKDGLVSEETVEGMQGDDHDHHNEENAYDEHVWLSLKNAEMICGGIAEKLSEKMPEKSDKIDEYTQKYIQLLRELDKRYADTVSAAEGRTLVFADRFPFRYLTEDYGLEYFAAFSGCSADSEASFETVAFLAKKLDELGLDSLIILESSERTLADTVISSTKSKKADVLIMDSMQSITSKDIDSGETYISIMEKNLSALTLALG